MGQMSKEGPTFPYLEAAQSFIWKLGKDSQSRLASYWMA